MKETRELNKLHNFSLPFVDDKIDFRSLIYALLAEKKTILGFILTLFIFGVIFAFFKTSQYQANVLFQVESKAKSNTLAANAPISLAGLSNNESSADIQIALIKSRFIITPVVESLGLDVSIKPHYFPLIGSWWAPHDSKELKKPLFGMNKFAWGGEHVEVTNFHLTSPDERKTYKLIAGKNQTYQLNTLDGKFLLEGKVGQLVQIKNNEAPLTILVKSLKANPGTEFFLSKTSTEKIVNKIISKLEISDLGQFNQTDKTGVLQMSFIGTDPQYVVNLLNKIAEIAVEKDIARKSLETSKMLDFLGEQLPLIKKSLNSSETALMQYRMKSGTIDLSLRSRMIISQLATAQKEIERVNLTRIMLLQKYTSIHPFIIALTGKKAALEEELKSLEKELQTLPTTDQTAAGLIRDIKVKTQLYILILNKIQEIEVTKAATISDLRVLSLAEIPNSALPSGRIFIILTSMLLGFVLGGLFVFVRKAFHSKVEDPNWLEQKYDIPTFAILPFSPEQDVHMKSYKKDNKFLPLLAKSSPRSLTIEALRSLRTSLQFALMGATNNIVSLLGVSPGIGKSFVAANFAFILADTNKRVLLIDGDLRKGYLQDYFTRKRQPGLSEVIISEIKLTEAIQKTTLPNLDFIASGKFPHNPSELLMSIQFNEILQMLSDQYDLVIIDTPPILAVTDGILIANQSGIKLMVLAHGKHQSKEIDLAIKRLEQNGVKIQGTVFNYLHANTQAHTPFNYYYAYGEEEKA